jgi:dTDP-4-amino-4,6-dideoxygalactose transaminase
MQRLDYFVAHRHEIAMRYDQKLKALPVITPWQHPDSYSGYHLYVIRLQLGKIKKTHLEVFEYLKRAEIGVNLHYIPVHLQPFYQKMGFVPGDYPLSEEYYREAISLPMYHTLTEEQQDEVIQAVSEALL